MGISTFDRGEREKINKTNQQDWTREPYDGKK